ncbi:hypothetical protein, partial [Pseudoalteromonas lipolytica]
MSQMTFGFDEREPEQPRKHKEPLKEPVQALEGTEVEMKTQPLLDFLLETKRIRLVDVKLAELLIGTDTSQKNEVFYLILLLAVA